MSGTRRATVHVTLDDSEHVAAAVRPDDTPEIDTHAEDGAVVVAVERDTTGGLRATVDDAVVNLDVAVRTIRHVRRRFGTTVSGGPGSQGMAQPDGTNETNEHQRDNHE